MNKQLQPTEQVDKQDEQLHHATREYFYNDIRKVAPALSSLAKNKNKKLHSVKTNGLSSIKKKKGY